MILDGALGTELARRGVPVEGPGWTAPAVQSHPDVIREVHEAYARAGCTVHTANTFRIRRVARPEEATHAAVSLARSSVPSDHLVAGSIAPLGDCYRPAETLPSPGKAHADLARWLTDAGVDLLLCETFPTIREGWAALEAAVATGRPSWVSFSPGPFAPFFSPEALREAGLGAVSRGAAAVLVNCLPVEDVRPYLEALLPLPIPVGVYANAADPERPIPPDDYAEAALGWRCAGADIVGGCCGTTPAHMAAVSARLSAYNDSPKPSQ